MSKPQPAKLLQRALSVLSRAEIERAWSTAEAANKALGGNVALRAEVAAHLLAQIIAEIGSTTTRPDDLDDVAEAVEGLSLYVNGRMIQIVTETANV